MAIRAVLFDWDGTLVHNPATGWPATSLTRYLRRELGIAATEDAFTAGFRATVREHQRERSHAWPPIAGLLREAFARLGWPASEEHVDCCAELFFNDLHRDTSVFDDARALLASLKFRGYRMGVVTNALFPGTMFAAKAAELGLGGYFEAVVSSADAGASKPHPDIYRQALAGLPAAPTETLFVGDRVDTDIAGALALGMPAALIARRGSPPESPEFAVVEHLSGVNGILGVNPVTAIDRPTPG